MRRPYVISRRRSGLKSWAYEVQFWNPERRRYIRRSATSLIDQLGDRARGLNPATKAGADAAARMALEAGLLASSEAHLGAYLADFWAADGLYAQAKRAAGRPLSAMYLANARSAIEHHALPWLRQTGQERLPLHRVTRGLVEDLVLHLKRSTSLSPGRINGVRKAVVVPLSRAADLGQLPRNPAAKALELPEPRQHRHLLTPAEVRAFFEKLIDPRHRAINLLAATTGLRLGECRGLRHEDVRSQAVGEWTYHYLALRHNWVEGEGEKNRLKADYRRLQDSEIFEEIPLPAGTAATLEALRDGNPWRNDFIFWSRLRSSPLSKSHIEEVYAAALEAIGIPREEQERRRLGFHSWRHWYNTMQRQHVDDRLLRKVMRHRTPAMTDHYDALTDEQRKQLTESAENLLDTPAETPPKPARTGAGSP